MPKANAPKWPRPTSQTRPFRNSRNQPSRTSPESELATDEVATCREEILPVPGPAERSPTLREVLSGLVPLEEEFGSIDDPSVKPEEIF